MDFGEANQVVEKTVKKVTEKVAKSAASSALQPPKAPSRTTSAGIANEAPIEDVFLLNFSIVNMDRGIGNGW